MTPYAPLMTPGDYLVTTVAGDGTEGHQDGPVADARFSHPADVALASDGR